MNTSLMTLEFEEQPVRVLTDAQGNPLWVLNDVCRILGIENPRNVAARLPKDAVHTMDIIDALGRPQQTNVVTLKGLNRVILDSRKPELDTFKDWVAEVMTQVETQGRYVVSEQHTTLDPNQPIAHLVEDTRKTTSKNLNAIACVIGGSQGAISANVGLSLAYFGMTPAQKVRDLEEQHGLKKSTSRGLPKTLTKTEPEKAVGYSITKQAALVGHDVETSVALGKTFEKFAKTALEAGLDPHSLLPQ